MKETLHLVQEWDKTFPKSDKAEHCKVTFCNRCGITLAADMYTPKGAGTASCHCGMRAVRRGQRAGVRALCADDGGKGIFDHCV